MRAPPFHNRGCRTQSAGHVTLSGKICKLLVHDTGAKTSTKVVVVVGELVPLVVLSHLLREVAPPLEISTPLLTAAAVLPRRPIPRMLSCLVMVAAMSPLHPADRMPPRPTGIASSVQ